MSFQVSPGVEVKEIDLTNVIPAVSTSIGGYAGYFNWGPVNQICLVSSEKELANKFGEPDAAHTQSFLTAASFLKYGNALKAVRATHTDLKNAVAGPFVQFDGSVDTITFEGSPAAFSNITTEPGSLTLVDTDDNAATLPQGSGAILVREFDVQGITATSATSVTAGSKITGVVGTVDDVGAADSSRTGTSSGNPYVIGTTDYGVLASDGSASAGTGATFTVAVDAAGAATVTVTAGGSGYAVDDQFTIADAKLGGGGGAALTFDVATVTASGVYTAGLASENEDLEIGEILEVYTTQDDATSPTFQLIVGETSSSDNTATFTVQTRASGSNVEDIVSFTSFPTGGVTGLKVYRTVAGVETALDGLTVDYNVKIAGIGISNVGGEYNEETTAIKLDGNTVVHDFTITQEDSDAAAATLIENEEQFESLVPTSTSLLGRLFARYPGTIGNGLRAYVLTNSNFGTAPTGIQAQFDGAPAPQPDVDGFDNPDAGKLFVHVLVMDDDGSITGTEGTVLEKYSFLELTEGAKLADGTNNYFKDVVNERSNWVYIARGIAGTLNPPATGYTFTGGVNSGTFSNGDITTALDVLADVETVDVNLLFAQNEPSGTTVKRYLATIASSRKDAVAFVSPQIDNTFGSTTPLDDVKGAFTGLPRGVEGSYTFFDSTALYVYNKYADNYVYIPAAGHMAGLCAKTDGLAEPWFSPAGFNRGSLLGVAKLAYNPKKVDRDGLYKAGINPIVSFPGEGIVLFGDKTGQAKPSAFDRINVRRLFIVLEKAIATAAKFQLFELNDEFTRAMFRNMTEPFLRDVKGRRGITDFLVVCDETNNTGEVIDTNRFVADIYIKPARSINFITLNFIATRTGVDFSEIVGK